MTDINKTLQQLHENVARELLKKIESGEAKAADFAQAITFLKNNGIDADALPNNPLGELSNSMAKVLPFTGTDCDEK